MKQSGTECVSWFDHPEWFEIGFDDMTSVEADFFEAAYKRYCPFPVRRVLEPGCGSGRLVVEMARRGYQVTGFDLSKPSLDYLRGRLKQLGLRAKLHVGDMGNFQVDGKIDAAFCTINTFRHLTTEVAAQRHLQTIAGALRPGGLYVLGMHLAPPDADPFCIERWIGQRGRTKVTTTLRIVASNRRQRLERLRISVLVREMPNGVHRGAKPSSNGHRNGKATAGRNGKSAPGKVIGRLRDEFDYRMYTATEIRRLFASVPQFELLDTFDFWYDLNDPQKLDNDAVDTVFVLRRR